MARRPACNQEVEVSTQAGERVGMCVCRVEVGCSSRLGPLAGQQGAELGKWEGLWGLQACPGTVDLWGWGGSPGLAEQRQGSWEPEASSARVK